MAVGRWKILFFSKRSKRLCSFSWRKKKEPKEHPPLPIDEGATALVTRLAGRLRTSRIVANTVQVSVQETLAYEGVIYVFFIKKWYIQKIVVSL